MGLRSVFITRDDLIQEVKNSHLENKAYIENTIRIPDYNAGVSLSISQESYKAHKDGIICLYHVFGSVNYSKDITINGAFFACLKSWHGTWAGSAYSLVIPVNEGDIIEGLPTISDTRERPKRVFYPLKTIHKKGASR